MRQIIDTKQTNHIKRHEYKGRVYQFHKDNGYIFSDNELMNEVVEYFLNLDGFKLKTEEKKAETKKESKKEKKTPKKEVKKKEEKEEEVKEEPKEEEIVDEVEDLEEKVEDKEE